MLPIPGSSAERAHGGSHGPRIAALLAGLLAAGCGGGGASPATPAPPAPPSDSGPAARLTFLGGPAGERVAFARPLAGGRVALAGTIVGQAAYATPAGPVTLQGDSPIDGFVAVLDGDDLVGIARIGGAETEYLAGLAAGPGGGFSVVGTSTSGLPDLGMGFPAPGAPVPGRTVGFLATYDDAAAITGGAVGHGVVAASGQVADVFATAVTHGPDGARWLAARGSGESVLAGASFSIPGGGVSVLRLDAAGHAQPPLATLSGNVEVHALEFTSGGDLLVVGTAEGLVRFSPTEQATVSVEQVFVARYAPTGECLGIVLPAPGGARCRPYDLAVGPDGSVFVVGHVEGPTTFGSVALPTVAGGLDGFVLALTPALVPAWADTWTWWTHPTNTSFPFVACPGVAALAGGGCVVVGVTSEGAEVGGTTFGEGLSYQADSAVARYGAGGDVAWVLVVGGPGDQYVLDVAVDAEGFLLLPGSTRGPITFRRGGEVTVRSSVHANTDDGFLLSLPPDGRVR